jgi:AraC-like DNA-binding protein
LEVDGAKTLLLREIDPFVRIANIFTLDFSAKNDIFHILKTPDCRMFYILAGSGELVAEDIVYELSAGCVVLFQSGTEYSWQPSEKGIKYIAVNFDYTHHFDHIKKSFHPTHSAVFDARSVLERIDFQDATSLNKPMYFRNVSKLESQLRLLTTEFYIGNDYCDELLSTVLKTIIISLVRESSDITIKNKDKELELTKKTVEFIQSHYSQKISNEMIANHFNFHPAYLNRVFKRYIGVPMHLFLRNYRLNVAMDMLRISDMGVAQIASMVGFADVPHFSVSFKKYTGLNPSRFREDKSNG